MKMQVNLNEIFLQLFLINWDMKEYLTKMHHMSFHEIFLQLIININHGNLRHIK